jgi:DNA polymerase
MIQVSNFPIFEMKLIDLTIRMFTEPVIHLDEGLLVNHMADVVNAKAELMDKVEHDTTELRSNPQFAALLEEQGVTPPMKVSPTTGKETYAFAKTDEGFKELLEHPNQTVQLLATVRAGVKSSIEETRTQRFLDVAGRGLLPIPLRYYAAHTGRWGGSDKINMQNLPRGSKLKYAMCAPEGYKFIDYDSSQIEARVLAWASGEDYLVEAFDNNEDVYKIMAADIYGKGVEDIDKGERFVGKQTILGCGYGMGYLKFCAQLKNFSVDIPEDECKRIINVYRQKNTAIRAFWKTADRAIKAMMADQHMTFGTGDVLVVEGKKGIRLPNGLYLRYPNIREEVDEETGDREIVYDTRRGRSLVTTKIYGGKLVENICQALARIIIGEQLLAINKKYKVAMTVHDASGSIVPDAEVVEACEYIEQCMRTRPTWAPDLPLECEGDFAQSYGECGG